MTLETAFQELSAKLSDLCTALKYLEVFIEDKPHRHKLAEDLAEEATDLWSRIDQASETFRMAQTTVQHPPDLGYARQALAICHEQVNVVARKFSTELRSDQQLRELTHLGRRLGGEWPGWAKSVQQTLDQCQTPLHDVNEALSQCWQELAERVSMPGVSVQTTTIGQQIRVVENSER